MTDRELLEAAAKAAGLSVKFLPAKPGMRAMFWQTHVGEWNPLTDDGDALRLAVRLGIQITQSIPIDPRLNAHAEAYYRLKFSESYNGDPYAATRRAIVRAAAAMVEGKA